jgi:glycosyltransferase involved in cell wall biosynthesis
LSLLFPIEARVADKQSNLRIERSVDSCGFVRPQSSAEQTATGETISPRLILLDDNIRDRGGHYFELAYLLLCGAEELGFRGVLVTHRDFDSPSIEDKDWSVHRIFSTRRLVRWSMGVDGESRQQRDLDGQPVGGSAIQNLKCRITDAINTPPRRPTHMLRQWSDDFCDMIRQTKPTPNDQLLVNTGDDFALLSLAHAMQRVTLPPLRIDVLFHFALVDREQRDRMNRLRQVGRQIRSALESLKPHQVHLHATTDSLAEQLRESASGCPIRAIPYPTRRCRITKGSNSEPLTAIIAGMPRAEKGKDAIAELLKRLGPSVLRSGRFRISMQLPADRWRRLVPRSLHDQCAPSDDLTSDGCSRALQIITSHLSTESYHQWLDTADVGLFLYEPARYEARCSGILLELMARGIPVIVPDQCWLSRQLELAGGHGSIGFIYRNRSEIPRLMIQFAEDRDAIRARCRSHAAVVVERHCGQNALLTMGFSPSVRNQHAA